MRHRPTLRRPDALIGRGVVRGCLALALVASFAVVAWITAPARPDVVQASDQSAVSRPASTPLDRSASTSTESSVEASPPVIADTPPSLEAAMSYAAGRGMVAVAVVDRVTGSYVDNGASGHTPMGSASLVKVLIADELLFRRAQGQIELGPAEFALMETMMMDSNDSAASSLYSQFGGVSLIEAALARHQLTESGPPADPRYWGNTMVTAHDVATFYNDLLGSAIPSEDRDYLLSLLRQMAPVAADGFNQLFGIAGIDPRPEAAVKQGWMCCLAGARNVHSTAVLGPDNRYVVVILTEYAESLPYSYGQETATEIARLIMSELAL